MQSQHISSPIKPIKMQIMHMFRYVINITIYMRHANYFNHLLLNRNILTLYFTCKPK